MKNLFIDVDVNDFVIDSLLLLIEDKDDTLSIYSTGTCYKDLNSQLFAGKSGRMLINSSTKNLKSVKFDLHISDSDQGINLDDYVTEKTKYINSDTLLSYTRGQSCLAS